METINLGCCSVSVKGFALLSIFVFLLLGLWLIIIGALVQGFFSEYVQFFHIKYEITAIGILILGCSVFITLFLGCCGKVFTGLQTVVMVCEIADCITVAVLHNEVKEAAEVNMIKSMDNYSLATPVTLTWDNLQQEHHCCGVQNFNTWFNSSYHRVPDSCCKVEDVACAKDISYNMTNACAIIYTQGCFDFLQASALNSLTALSGGVVALILMQILTAWMLRDAVREHYEVLQDSQNQ